MSLRFVTSSVSLPSQPRNELTLESRVGDVSQARVSLSLSLDLHTANNDEQRYGVDGDTHVVKETEADMRKDVHDLAKAVPFSDCRYIVFEHAYKTPDGRPNDKLYFISWFPRSSSNPQKMLYTTARKFLREACPGCIDITATTAGEILEIVLKGSVQKDDDEASDDGKGDWMDD